MKAASIHPTTASSPKNIVAARDGQHQSIWQAGATSIQKASAVFDPEKMYDALIVGGGITGITTALLLQKQGKECVLVDAHSIGYGTTGGTSAHINTFADTGYNEVEKAFGEEASQLFAQAIQEAIVSIRNFITAYHIKCDYEIKQGFVYAEDEKQAEALTVLYESCLKVGVKAKVVEHIPSPVPYLKAVAFDDQAQFHPLKYLSGLQDKFVQLGGIILENTRIEEIDSKDHFHIAIAEKARIKAQNVVYATHIPPGGINVLHFLCAPYRSYVLAAKLADGHYPEGLVYDMQEPYHYFRSHLIDGQKYLLVGGNDHKTGHEDPEKVFKELEAYVRNYYSVASIDYRWSSQYYVPADGLPYIGQLPGASDGIYAATGYNGNGMMLGTAAAKVLSDLVMNRASQYADLFDPSRIKPLASAGEAAKEGADVIYHFIVDRLSVHKINSVKDLPNDCGIVAELEGQKIAVYKDKKGNLNALNPICTHAKCVVNWNNFEKSWDCPCHGARYDAQGSVLTGPARKNLSKVTLGNPREVV